MISVIIPAYNSEETLAAALTSVANQNGNFELEVIVVNDGSSDSTSIVAKETAKLHNINLILIEQINSGVATARNNGVKNSTGDFIAFLDADDVWLSDKLELQMNFLLESKFDLVGGNFKGLNVNYNRLDTVFADFKEVKFKDLLMKHYFQPSAVIMRRSIFEKVGGFKDGMTHAEEGLLFYKICYMGRCALYSKDVIDYGNGKHPFASGKGLSSNLWKMEKGELLNYHEIYKCNMIYFSKYLFLIGFSLAKYMRRVFLSRVFN
ncbi:glycosyltransferase family 2 protein [Pectobacterium brasiliense]|uniref:glycosyltransferase family 2 protein n=1 Tax=Pectobacterium brasiliense TaxID=180957 RepID=UPI001B35857F|nr:glycosyltransferase family A protein [Pectobacterium brasiliense]MBQ4794605.1 glycosyltransferase [Pectobacterium versatile]MCA5918295.1 glycosyltransferase family 2 protein [Pectobacterium brasiliense]MCA5926166.1 glycosyltransferase family 2 protein [Pectobacterium brasiliense]MCA5934159.1 glycosyltransferase family 2 protein [Pectobacterium brasiliense]MCA5938341.1 glycosyltransferase family 2 protein [Pectobacterium brasiliense]